MDLTGVTAVSANVAYAYGQWGSFDKTTDGGANWVTVSTGNNMATMDAVDTHTVFMGNPFDTTNASDDGGTTWTDINGTDTFVKAIDATTVWSWDATGSLYRTTSSTAIPDWVGGAGQWTIGAAAQFGVCLQDAAVATVDGLWTEDVTTSPGVCQTTAIDPWRAIPAATSRVAYTTVNGTTGRVDLVWGYRAGMAQTKGTYRATVLIEALSPG
jgi:hypothetical protein